MSMEVGPGKGVDKELSSLWRKYEAKDAEPLNPDDVFDDLERVVSQLWAKAKEHDLTDVLNDEQVPQTAVVRVNYERVMFEAETNEFDLYGFKKLFNKLDGVNTILDDLIFATNHGF